MQTAHSQTGKQLHYNFQHMDEHNGLIENSVTNIDQDENGYIWFATNFNGVQRYDGVRFQNYRKDFLPDGGDNPKIEQISTLGNQILASSGKKVFRYNMFRNQFLPCDLRLFPDYTYKFIDFRDEDNRPWYMNDYAIYSYDRVEKRLKTELIVLAPATGEGSRFVFDTTEEKCWLAFEKGFYLFDLSMRTVHKAHEKSKNPLLRFLAKYSLQNSVNRILIDRHDNLWLTTNSDKILRYDLRTKQISSYSLEDIIRGYPGEKHNRGPLFSNGIYEDNHAYLWIATYGAGLLRYNALTDKFDYIIPENDGSKGIKYNFNITNLFQDRQNNLWVSTDKGINVFNPYQHYFKILRHEKDNSLSLPATEINSLIQTKNKQLLIGTWGGGITVFDSTLQFKTRFVFKNPDRNMIWCFLEDNNGKIWTGCQNGYINVYDPLTGNIDTTRTIMKNRSAIHCMAKNKKGDIFFGTDDGRLIKWDNTFDSTYEYTIEKSSNGEKITIQSLFIDKGQNIWTGTDHGFFHFDPIKTTFTDSFLTFHKKEKVLLLNWVTSIQQSNDSTLLVGFLNGGGYYFNLNSKVFTPWEVQNGLKTKTITAIKKDRNGHIWFTSDFALYSFIPGKKNSTTSYNINNGIISSQFFAPQFINLQNGLWATATKTDVLIFKPDEIVIKKGKHSPVRVTGFKVFGKPLLIDSLLENNLPVRLKYNQNFLTIEFATLNFSSIYNRKYFYKLSGINDDWILADQSLTARYTNLSPGTYHFEVKSEDGNEEGLLTSFQIIISPPFWKNQWFVFLCIAGIGFMMYILVKRRIAVIRYESGLKQKIVETEMAALRAQMNPHFIFNCISAIDNLIQNNEKDKATSYLARFAKLIRSVLDSSKTNLVPFDKDLEAIRLYIDLEQFRCSNRFQYTIIVDNELLNGDYRVPPLLIQPFIENAIHHGLLNKQEGDRKLTIFISINDEIIHYTIIDNGVGRKISRELNLINKPEHISYGIQISKERIKFYNQSPARNEKKAGINGESITITDLYENNLPSGTKVKVKLKSDENN